MRRAGGTLALSDQHDEPAIDLGVMALRLWRDDATRDDDIGLTAKAVKDFQHLKTKRY
jgi:hypothetical protein